jgi:cyclophilin family peptidyl-prolyl cis-trans isomerase
MKRRLLLIAVACAGALAVAAPVSAYTPPETNPRIVITTTKGTILVALVPENAPQHAAELLAAISGGDFNNSQVARVSPKFYVQLVGKLSAAKLSGQPVERQKVGNIRGALSVYDRGAPGEVPTLMFVLVDSPQLDTDYSTVGFVEAGMKVIESIADTPSVGDHQPEVPITVTGVHVATTQERILLRQAEQTALATDGTAVLAAIFIIACALFIAALASAFHDRLTKQRMKSLAILIALLVFFAVWVAFGGTEQGSGLMGVALFCGAIGMFRLMGKFERPAPPSDLSPVAKPPQFADRKPHIEPWLDQPKSDLEVVLGQGNAPAGRSGSTGG